MKHCPILEVSLCSNRTKARLFTQNMLTDNVYLALSLAISAPVIML